uniref:Uncharacterized protein n=1 Tax=uncultured marine virus TaxID=186617 RepID=A0A0F7L6B8_9VIRU|nr:hypothetical protein [uncultured marine virus]
MFPLPTSGVYLTCCLNCGNNSTSLTPGVRGAKPKPVAEPPALASPGYFFADSSEKKG